MNKSALGWDDFFQAHFSEYDDSSLIAARVLRQDKDRYRVHDGEREFNAVIRGAMQRQAELRPAVGDWVVVEMLPGEDKGVVTQVLPRKTLFSRKTPGVVTREQPVAANVDTLFLISGLDHDFNVRRIERYVTLAWESGAVPVILLNKIDLCDDAEARIAEAANVAMGVDIIALSASTGEGLDRLDPYLAPGQTVAFLGSSGVGKSTLVNRLAGKKIMDTAEVREDDSRGRHTTTFREMIFLESGAIVVDTPGMRELQLWGDESDLAGAFSDFEALAAGCKFRNCGHETEPGCAVLAALETGELAEDRYQSYIKLKKELASLAWRKGEAGRMEEKRRGKQFSRMLKEVERYNQKRR